MATTIKPTTPSSPKSPTSPKTRALATVVLQATQFFDDWCSRVTKTSLGKLWTRDECMLHALELLCLSGISLTRDDMHRLIHKKEEDMIKDLCTSLSQEQREHFDTITHTLQVNVLTATRIRQAIDRGDEKELVEVLAEEDHGQIKDAILKETVVCGSRDVGKLYRCQETWVENTEAKLLRLTKSAEVAAQAHANLLKVETALSSVESESKQKLKKALGAFMSSSESVMLAASFSQWSCHTIKTSAERNRRKEFEAQLSAMEAKIMQSKEKTLAAVRSQLKRSAINSNESLLAVAFEAFQQERENAQREREDEKAMMELTAKLQEFDKERVAAAKKIFARVGSNFSASSLIVAFQAFAQAVQAAKHERELEQATEEQKAKLDAWVKQSKADARARLERGFIQSDAAMQLKVFQKWAEVAGIGDSENPLASDIRKTEKKLAGLKCSLHGIAESVSGRTYDQEATNLLMQVVQHWELEAKVNRVDKWYKNRLDSKRKQLDSVRVLFRSFAEKLEEGLTVEEADSARLAQPGRKKGMTSSVSLPDIHAGKRR